MSAGCSWWYSAGSGWDNQWSSARRLNNRQLGEGDNDRCAVYSTLPGRAYFADKDSRFRPQRHVCLVDPNAASARQLAFHLFRPATAGRKRRCRRNILGKSKWLVIQRIISTTVGQLADPGRCHSADGRRPPRQTTQDTVRTSWRTRVVSFSFVSCPHRNHPRRLQQYRRRQLTITAQPTFGSCNRGLRGSAKIRGSTGDPCPGT